ncbi:MAG: transposase [Christensenellaceae bacterium]|jgi:transposase|nr:transposase [Christensenellaceae bacterium]
MILPDWAAKFKEKNREVRLLRGNYYLYEKYYEYSSEKKKKVLKTGAYLGTITPQGLTPKKISFAADKLQVQKSYGSVAFVSSISQDILETLRDVFKTEKIADTIYTISLLRCLNETPFKRIQRDYDHSYISEMLPNLGLSSSHISRTMETIGDRRDLIVETMNRISNASNNIIIDGSKIKSWSKNMSFPKVGHNHDGSWTPQVNSIYVFSTEPTIEPVFYRCITENIPDIKALELTLLERNKDVNYTLVADTGFSSEENINLLNGLNVKYIIPLNRNSLEAKGIVCDNKTASAAFTFHKKMITAFDIEKDGYRIIIFLDAVKKSAELSDMVGRIEEKNEKICASKNLNIRKSKILNPVEEMSNKAKQCGAIIIKTNKEDSPQKIYELYKQRMQIEQNFVTLKNILGEDSSYMHNNKTFECWCFFNHISLLLAYRVLNILRRENLASSYSLTDVFTELGDIYKQKFGETWLTTKITKKTKLLCTRLGFLSD